MIGPGESSVAQFTVEGLVARVFALVTRELVTAREPPAAVLPLADVGLLPGVSAEVGLQVAGLGVRLPAARMLAGVGRGLTLQHDHDLAGLRVAGGRG